MAGAAAVRTSDWNGSFDPADQITIITTTINISKNLGHPRETFATKSRVITVAYYDNIII